METVDQSDMDESDLLDQENIVRYKLLIGITQWAVNLLQISLLFILFAHNLENSIGYFLL